MEKLLRNDLLPLLKCLKEEKKIIKLANTGQYKKVDAVLAELNYQLINNWFKTTFIDGLKSLNISEGISDIPEEYILPFIIVLSKSDYDETEIIKDREELRGILYKQGKAGKKIADTLENEFINSFHSFSDFMNNIKVEDNYDYETKLLELLKKLEEEGLTELANTGQYKKVDEILEKINYRSFHNWMRNILFERSLKISYFPRECQLTFIIVLSKSRYDQRIFNGAVEDVIDLQEVICMLGKLGKKVANRLGEISINEYHSFAEFMNDGDEWLKEWDE